MHCYKGLGVQRVALQAAIVPAVAKGQSFSAFPFDEYEHRWESWRVLIMTAVQFNVPLPDPSLMLLYYEMGPLGGDSPLGVLEQYPPLRQQLENVKLQHDTVNLRAGHTEKVQNIIANFHTRVQSYMKATNPKTGRVKKDKTKREDDENLRSLDPKGGKGGKGKEKGGKEKGKGKGDDGKAGAPKGQESSSKMLEYLRAKPTSYFTDIQSDGQPRALCESFVLQGKCSHGKECIFGSHGGHPAVVTEDMKRVARDRKKARDEKNAAFKKKAQQRKEYAEIKRRLDAGEQIDE